MPRVTAKHLAEMRGSYEPQRSFDWLIEFEIPGRDVITMTIEQGFTPTEMNEVIELPYGNETQYVAGKARWEFGQLSIRDMVDKDVAKYIDEWRRQVYDPKTGDIKFAREYKSQGNIILLDPSGGSQRMFKVIGLWPQQVSFGDLDYSNSDIVRIQVVVAFDRAWRV
jgi:hypothetical protein